MRPKFIFIYVTCPHTKLAQKIAEQLVREQLVACANIVPGMKSVYKWQGKICRDSETILILKSKMSLFIKIEKRIRELHSYENPCVVALPVIAGSSKYLSWLQSSCTLKIKN